MATNIINTLLLHELRNKKYDRIAQRVSKVNYEYQKIIFDLNFPINDFNIDKLAQVIIMEAEFEVYNQSSYYINALNNEDLRQIISYVYRNDLEIINNKFKTIRKNFYEVFKMLKKEDYVRNLYVCPEMQFLYYHGFLEITDFDMHIPNKKHIFVHHILKKYLTFDLIKFVLKLLE
jgi:hypothetical protein